MMIDIIHMSKEELLEKSTIAFVLTAKSEIETLFSQKPVSWEMKGDFLVVFMG